MYSNKALFHSHKNDAVWISLCEEVVETREQHLAHQVLEDGRGLRGPRPYDRRVQVVMRQREALGISEIRFFISIRFYFMYEITQ